MSWRKIVVLAGLVCVSTGLGTWVSASEDAEETFDISSPEWLLRPVQDESSLERTIAKYIRQKMDINAEVRFLDDDMEDMAIYYPLNPDEAPDLRVKVDTYSSRDDGDQVAERVISLTAWYVMPDEAKTPELRQKTLEVLNSQMLQFWTPDRFMIDGDGDIQIETFINIPHQQAPVHCECVLDSLMRMTSGWNRCYLALDDAIDLSDMDTD